MTPVAAEPRFHISKFILNIIHRPEMVPEYAEKVMGLIEIIHDHLHPQEFRAVPLLPVFHDGKTR